MNLCEIDLFRVNLHSSKFFKIKDAFFIAFDMLFYLNILEGYLMTKFILIFIFLLVDLFSFLSALFLICPDFHYFIKTY